jgi:hypothetical protein
MCYSAEGDNSSQWFITDVWLYDPLMRSLASRTLLHSDYLLRIANTLLLPTWPQQRSNLPCSAPGSITHRQNWAGWCNGYRGSSWTMLTCRIAAIPRMRAHHLPYNSATPRAPGTTKIYHRTLRGRVRLLNINSKDIRQVARTSDMIRSYNG